MNKFKRNIVITGATGFLESHLIKRLLAQKSYKLTALVRTNQFTEVYSSLCDIRDYESVSETIARSDIIIHLASLVGVSNCDKNHYNSIDINILGTLNILDALNIIENQLFFLAWQY